MAESVKPIILKDEETGETYTLEFNRESVKFAESRKFELADVAKYPMTKVPEFFYYAFRMHHRNVPREKTDRILFEKLGGMPEGMLERLSELYMFPLYSLAEGEDKSDEKNVKMTVEM